MKPPPLHPWGMECRHLLHRLAARYQVSKPARPINVFFAPAPRSPSPPDDLMAYLASRGGKVRAQAPCRTCCQCTALRHAHGMAPAYRHQAPTMQEPCAPSKGSACPVPATEPGPQCPHRSTPLPQPCGVHPRAGAQIGELEQQAAELRQRCSEQEEQLALAGRTIGALHADLAALRAAQEADERRRGSSLAQLHKQLEAEAAARAQLRSQLERAQAAKVGRAARPREWQGSPSAGGRAHPTAGACAQGWGAQTGVPSHSTQGLWAAGRAKRTLACPALGGRYQQYAGWADPVPSRECHHACGVPTIGISVAVHTAVPRQAPCPLAPTVPRSSRSPGALAPRPPCALVHTHCRPRPKKRPHSSGGAWPTHPRAHRVRSAP